MTHAPKPEMLITEYSAVKSLGEAIGYGRVMQLCEEIWDKKMPGASHTVGPCSFFMVPCYHPTKDKNGHCEICCGAGRITKGVAKLSDNARNTHPTPPAYVKETPKTEHMGDDMLNAPPEGVMIANELNDLIWSNAHSAFYDGEYADTDSLVESSIEAIKARDAQLSQAKEGWVLVPREPTSAMKIQRDELLEALERELSWLKHIRPQIVMPDSIDLGFGQAIRSMSAIIAKARGGVA